jgi:hypothetical protein
MWICHPLVVPPIPKKKKNPTMELVKLKKQYFDHKIQKRKEKERTQKLYVEETLKYKKARLELYKRKVELEEKKIQASCFFQNLNFDSQSATSKPQF